MSDVPFTWRARSGYVPATEARVPLPPAAPLMVSQHNYYIAVPQPQPLAYAAPIFKAASTASNKSSSSGSSSSSATKVGLAGSTNPNAPPAMSVNANYMFPTEHTKLHIFNKSSKVWEDKHAGKSFNFKIFNVSTAFTPAMVIENVLAGKAAPKGWAITEVVEKGDGAWAKGTTIEHGGDRAGASLSSMGWTGNRGNSLPPVWVVLHKV